MKKIAALFAASLLSVPVFATSVYMTDSFDQFGTLNLTTGVFTPVNTTPAIIFGMGFAPNGTLYATDNKTPSDVYTINPATGVASNLGASVTSYSAIGSTVGSNGLIYAVNTSFPSAAFYTINPSTLAANTINGSLGFQSDGLAVFDNGHFYTDNASGGVGGTDLLEQVDPTTGAATPVGSSLGFDVFAGTLVGNTIYAVGHSTSTPVLLTIDPSTGIGTLVADITGMTSGAFPDALAYNNVPTTATPEPSTEFLAGFGVFLFAGFWRARARISRRPA